MSPHGVVVHFKKGAVERVRENSLLVFLLLFIKCIIQERLRNRCSLPCVPVNSGGLYGFSFFGGGRIDSIGILYIGFLYTHYYYVRSILYTYSVMCIYIDIKIQLGTKEKGGEGDLHH